MDQKYVDQGKGKRYAWAVGGLAIWEIGSLLLHGLTVKEATLGPYLVHWPVRFSPPHAVIHAHALVYLRIPFPSWKSWCKILFLFWRADPGHDLPAHVMEGD